LRLYRWRKYQLTVCAIIKGHSTFLVFHVYDKSFDWRHYFRNEDKSQELFYFDMPCLSFIFGEMGVFSVGSATAAP
jgi:hypothetical protein